MANWYSDLEQLGPALLSFGVGIGFALYFLYELMLGITGVAANTINQLITGVYSGVVTFWPLIITAIFIAVAYIILRKSGLIGGGHSGRNRN